MSSKADKVFTLTILAHFDEMPDIEELQRCMEELNGIACIDKAELLIPAETRMDVRP